LLLLATGLILNRLMDYTAVIVAGTSILNVIVGILIHRCVCRPDDLVGKALNLKPVVIVGGLSYSLYLWQQLFINRSSAAWMNAFPQTVLFAIATALVSFYLLEKPLLMIRRRLH